MFSSSLVNHVSDMLAIFGLGRRCTMKSKSDERMFQLVKMRVSTMEGRADADDISV